MFETIGRRALQLVIVLYVIAFFALLFNLIQNY